jgi:hypothetical protein
MWLACPRWEPALGSRNVFERQLRNEDQDKNIHCFSFDWVVVYGLLCVRSVLSPKYLSLGKCFNLKLI